MRGKADLYHLHQSLWNVAHLEIVRVSKSFQRGSRRISVLSEISFSIEEGELLLVMGASGSGKSTLLRLLNRLIEPDSGNILFRGTDIRSMEPVLLRRRVVLVPQVPFMFEGSVLDNILTGTRLWNMRADVHRLLEDFQIPEHLLSSRAASLSVGEAQRVALARALAIRPEILLLDEPTSALDEKTKEQVERALLEYNRRGLTMLWVSHESGQAERLGGRVMRLEEGRIVA